ncbi:MAG: TetR/AcrR family transcriptional regulator [Clostridiales bacterium]|nr:TetR/AcrR family transcriptional regulator [Clostridiales bacterium]
MRVVKEADERRNEILDAAEELFVSNGYDKTSVQQIIDKIGIAKGTFYYYFRSKEELLNGIVERYNKLLLNRAIKIAEEKGLSCEMRFYGIIKAMQIAGEVNPAIMEQIHTPQNVLLHQKMTAGVITGLTPLLTDIVNEGIKKGIFKTDFPKESVEMLLVYGVTMLDGDFVELTQEERMQKVVALVSIGETLLGFKKGGFMEFLAENSEKGNTYFG